MTFLAAWVRANPHLLDCLVEYEQFAPWLMTLFTQAIQTQSQANERLLTDVLQPLLGHTVLTTANDYQKSYFLRSELLKECSLRLH